MWWPLESIAPISTKAAFTKKSTHNIRSLLGVSCMVLNWPCRVAHPNSEQADVSDFETPNELARLMEIESSTSDEQPAPNLGQWHAVCHWFVQVWNEIWLRTPHIFTFFLASQRSNLKLIFYHPLVAPGTTHSTNNTGYMSTSHKTVLPGSSQSGVQQKKPRSESQEPGLGAEGMLKHEANTCQGLGSHWFLGECREKMQCLRFGKVTKAFHFPKYWKYVGVYLQKISQCHCGNTST